MSSRAAQAALRRCGAGRWGLTLQGSGDSIKSANQYDHTSWVSDGCLILLTSAELRAYRWFAFSDKLPNNS